jgi:(E)-4-hydroxy-3-methylbut-2-enyl-diphosphate synthase
MATGVAPAPLPHVRVHHGGVGFTRSVDFAKVLSAPGAGTMRASSSRGRALVAKSSSTGSETMELEPSSEGSPLLGIICVLLCPCTCIFQGKGSVPRLIFALLS